MPAYAANAPDQAIRVDLVNEIFDGFYRPAVPLWLIPKVQEPLQRFLAISHQGGQWNDARLLLAFPISKSYLFPARLTIEVPCPRGHVEAWPDPDKLGLLATDRFNIKARVVYPESPGVLRPGRARWLRRGRLHDGVQLLGSSSIFLPVHDVALFR